MLQREQLFGTWSLESWRVFVGGEQREPPLGPHAAGQLCYVADGGMTAILVGDRLEESKENEVDSDIALIRTMGCIAYAGYFEVKGLEVHHHVRHSSVPSWVGQTLVRSAHQPEPLRLDLATPRTQNRSGQEIVNEIRWRKVCSE